MRIVIVLLLLMSSCVAPKAAVQPETCGPEMLTTHPRIFDNGTAYDWAAEGIIQNTCPYRIYNVRISFEFLNTDTGRVLGSETYPLKAILEAGETVQYSHSGTKTKLSPEPVNYIFYRRFFDRR